MKVVLCWFALLISYNSFAQSKDENAIKVVLNRQIDRWNKADLEGFMNTYWHDDSLMFIGKSGIRWGWRTTLENYRKNYPDTVAMGKLSFDIILIKKLSQQYYYVVGKWSLKRTIGDLNGHFDLVFRKINGNWYIIADHSS